MPVAPTRPKRPGVPTARRDVVPDLRVRRVWHGACPCASGPTTRRRHRHDTPQDERRETMDEESFRRKLGEILGVMDHTAAERPRQRRRLVRTASRLGGPTARGRRPPAPSREVPRLRSRGDPTREHLPAHDARPGVAWRGGRRPRPPRMTPSSRPTSHGRVSLAATVSTDSVGVGRGRGAFERRRPTITRSVARARGRRASASARRGARVRDVRSPPREAPPNRCRKRPPADSRHLRDRAW